MKKYYLRIKSKLIKLFYLRNPINVFLGQKIYGNDSGLIANLVGNFVISRNKGLNLDSKTNILSDQNLDNLKKDGFVYLDFSVSQEIMKDLCNEFKNEVNEFKIPKDGRLEVSSINNHIFYEKFKSTNLVISERIKTILEGYYNSGFKIINTHIYRTIKVDNTEDSIEVYGSTEFWHNDSSTVDSIKLFVLLTDTDEDNGPMHIINKSDTKIIVRNRFRKNIEGKSNGIIEDRFKVTKFTGKIGNMMIADSNLCLHRGDIPKSDTYRDMLVFYITTSKKPFTKINSKESSREQFYGFKRLLES